MAYADQQLIARGRGASDRRKLELFRGVVRSLAREPAKIVSELRFSGGMSSAARERLDFVAHHLDYLIRLCDGLV